MKRMGSVVGLALPGDHLLAAGKAKVVRIGCQKSGAFLLVKQEGSLEKRLAPLGKFADTLARLLERRLPRWNPVYRAA